MTWRSIAVCAALAALSLAAGPADQPGLWIERSTASFWPSDAVAADARLVTHDVLGTGLDTQMQLVRVKQGAEVRTQIRVLRPEKAAGTVYEVYSSPRQPVERVVYSPTFERTRDVSGSRRHDSFLASEFSYEDLELTAPGESQWVSSDRVLRGGRELVRVTSEPSSFYSRVEMLIDPKSGLPVSTTYFDNGGKPFKVETFDAVRDVNGHPLPTHIEMRDVQNGEKSDLYLTDVKLDAKVDPKVFDESPNQARRQAQARAQTR
ncbi:MAG TPA: outer membrane lipoprotein-sorting protein [Myxococcota bacterium]|nr:outer membrane lipoprotein-sorting protein [Myxococcota bacterium]